MYAEIKSPYMYEGQKHKSTPSFHVQALDFNIKTIEIN